MLGDVTTLEPSPPQGEPHSISVTSYEALQSPLPSPSSWLFGGGDVKVEVFFPRCRSQRRPTSCNRREFTPADCEAYLGGPLHHHLWLTIDSVTLTWHTFRRSVQKGNSSAWSLITLISKTSALQTQNPSACFLHKQRWENSPNFIAITELHTTFTYPHYRDEFHFTSHIHNTSSFPFISLTRPYYHFEIDFTSPTSISPYTAWFTPTNHPFYHIIPHRITLHPPFILPNLILHQLPSFRFPPTPATHPALHSIPHRDRSIRHIISRGSTSPGPRQAPDRRRAVPSPMAEIRRAKQLTRGNRHSAYRTPPRGAFSISRGSIWTSPSFALSSSPLSLSIHFPPSSSPSPPPSPVFIVLLFSPSSSFHVQLDAIS